MPIQFKEIPPIKMSVEDMLRIPVAEAGSRGIDISDLGISDKEFGDEVQRWLKEGQSPQKINEAIDMTDAIRNKDKAKRIVRAFYGGEFSKEEPKPEKPFSFKEAFQTVKGLVKSKVQQFKVNEKLISFLTNEIAPPSIAGEKNYNIHHKTIKEFIKKGDYKGAMEYVDTQQQKVWEQSQ